MDKTFWMLGREVRIQGRFKLSTNTARGSVCTWYMYMPHVCPIIFKLYTKIFYAKEEKFFGFGSMVKVTLF